MFACVFCARACSRYPCMCFRQTTLETVLLENLFSQTKVGKGAPREHFSLQMKSDENRPIITSESFQSATFIRKPRLCVCVCVCLIHLSAKLWVTSKNLCTSSTNVTSHGIHDLPPSRTRHTQTNLDASKADWFYKEERKGRIQKLLFITWASNSQPVFNFSVLHLPHLHTVNCATNGAKVGFNLWSIECITAIPWKLCVYV